MRIYESLKSILDYVKSKLATVATTGSYNDLLDKPNTNELYDLKIVPQGIIEKGWTNINNSTKKDLSKTDVPTLYADLLYKYNNVDKEQLAVASKTTNSELPVFYSDGYYYYTKNSGEKGLYRATKIDLSDGIKVFATSHPCTGCIFNDTIYLLEKIQNGSNRDFNFYVLDKNLTLIKNFSFSFSFGVDNDAAMFMFYDNKIFFKTRERRFCVDLQEETAAAIFYGSGGSYNGVGNDIIFGDYYYTTYKGKVYRRKINPPVSTEMIDSYIGSYSASFFIHNNKLKVMSGNGIYIIDTENFTLTYDSNPLSGSYPYLIKQIGDTYYLLMRTQLLSTKDFSTFNTLISDAYNYSGPYWSSANIILSQDSSIIVWYEQLTITYDYAATYFYSGFVSKVYSDTYTINGSSVVINYYKYNDFKICVPDISNDSNLETVYTALGYLPYFRIDTANEVVNVIRDARQAYKYLFVADEYEDINLPSLSWKGLSEVAFTGSYNDLKDKPSNVKTFTNVVADTWVSDNTYPEYSYKCELSCQGVSNSMFAQVLFAQTEAESGNYAPFCFSSTDTITIYSKVNTTITIPTIVVIAE